MTIEHFIAELKNAREAKHLSLSDISDRTMINVKFLEAIEQGNMSVLPETYIRAFIREYAAAVGLEPKNVMQKYDEAVKGEHPSVPSEQPVAAPASEPARSHAPPQEPIPMNPRIAKTAILIILVVVVVVSLWNLIRQEPAPPTKETPFQSIIKENEDRFASAPPQQMQNPQTESPSTPKDSLILRAITTDSVWAQIVVDSDPPHEYLFGSGARMAWRARDRFSITLGNAGAVEFYLNKKKIGTLGKRGVVVRNVELNRKTLAQ
jgi:cytoskeletal protein RodZ